MINVVAQLTVVISNNKSDAMSEEDKQEQPQNSMAAAAGASGLGQKRSHKDFEEDHLHDARGREEEDVVLEASRGTSSFSVSDHDSDGYHY